MATIVAMLPLLTVEVIYAALVIATQTRTTFRRCRSKCFLGETME